jgi:hypothetical protein
VSGGRFHAVFLQGAHESAHPVVTINMRHIVEPIASQDISGKAAVFQTAATIKFNRKIA